jgi:hypothetical protein
MISIAKTLFAAATALALTATAQAQDAFELDPGLRETAEDLRDRALESDLAWNIVESLTTEIGPRLGGSEAEARARDWGADLFRDLGFENVRIETFNMPFWTRGDMSISLTEPYEVDLYGTALGGSGRSPRLGAIESEIVYFRTLADLQAVGDGALDGKIAFVDGEPIVRSQTGAGYGPANQRRRVGWQHAERAEARALIVRSVGSASRRFPHTGMMSARGQFNLESPETEENWARIPVIAVSNPDADQIRRLHELGLPLEARLSSGAGFRGERESGNVVAEIVGRELPEEIVLIGGHLDSWDLGTGALDDGAGVAITTAAAALIGQMPQRPRRTIRVVMFGAEEVGLLGARAYANDNMDDVPNIVLATESDFGARNIWQLVSNVSEEGTAALDAAYPVLAPLGIVRGGSNVPGGGPDIIPLAMMGVPTIRLAQDGTDYFDFHHTPDDTLDKIKKDELAQNVAAYAALIYLIAEMDVEFRPEREE